MLNDFSFEELSVTEACLLKKSFKAFQSDLEENIFKQNTISSLNDFGEFEKNFDKKNTPVSTDEDMLIAKVSHKMRTPLNGIIGFTDLLKEDRLTQKQLEQVNAIESASHSLMNIINELLKYTKPSAGLEKEPIDFNFYGGNRAYSVAGKGSKIDLYHMLDECGGKIEMLEELVSLYKQNALEFIGNSKLCLQNNNFEELKFAAHKIKSWLAMMQTYNLHDIVLEMHRLCETTKDLEQLKCLYHNFIEEYVITEKEMSITMEEIKNK